MLIRGKANRDWSSSVLTTSNRYDTGVALKSASRRSSYGLKEKWGEGQIIVQAKKQGNIHETMTTESRGVVSNGIALPATLKTVGGETTVGIIFHMNIKLFENRTPPPRETTSFISQWYSMLIYLEAHGCSPRPTSGVHCSWRKIKCTWGPTSPLFNPLWMDIFLSVSACCTAGASVVCIYCIYWKRKAAVLVKNEQTPFEKLDTPTNPSQSTKHTVLDQ